jgi:hypothetical protein
MSHHYQEDRLYHLTGVIYPDLQDKCKATPQPSAQCTFQCAEQPNAFTMPVSISSLAIFRDKDQKQIAMLESVIEAGKRLNEVRSQEIDRLWGIIGRNQTEATTLQKACADWCDKTLRLRVKVSTLEDQLAAKEKEVEAYAKSVDELEELQAVHIKELDYLAERIVELRTSGSAKERDEYSKALDAKTKQYESTIKSTRDSLLAYATAADKLANEVAELKTKASTAGLKHSLEMSSQDNRLRHMCTKFEQATKEAKKWKETATTRAKEIERLANLVIERTNERNLLSGKGIVEPYKTGPTITFGNATDLEIPKFKTKASESLKTLDLRNAPTLTAHVKWDTGFGLLASIAGPTLGDRVATLEAKVEKLEKDDMQGYRELGPHERVQDGDQYYNKFTESWNSSWLAGPEQQVNTRYRRKV